MASTPMRVRPTRRSFQVAQEALHRSQALASQAIGLSRDDASPEDTDFETDPVKPPKQRPRKRRRVAKPADGDDAIKNDFDVSVEMEDGGDHLKLVAPHANSVHIITSSDAQTLRRGLLLWYAGVHTARGMPWRKPYDPSLDKEGRAQRAYEVWISEIMLQQTQVATVIPYYTRWMTKFPTIRELADSDIETVNALWKGLGYYSRASRILQAAQKVLKDFDGRLPDNAPDLIAHIPGIGRYSAGAISSIAYGQCEPVLDGNVTRLLSRFLAIHANPKSKQVLDLLWEGATAMVRGCTEDPDIEVGEAEGVKTAKAVNPGDVNQALIELGSTVCKVRDPDCGGCPLRRSCRAYPANQPKTDDLEDIEESCTICEPLPASPGAGTDVTIYPMKVVKKAAREETDIVCVVEWRSPKSGERWFLLAKRPEKGLLAGLHEFPTIPNASQKDFAEASIARDAHKILSQLLADTISPAPVKGKKIAITTDEDDMGLRISRISPAGDVLHVFSHIRKTYSVHWVELSGSAARSDPSPHRSPGTMSPPVLKPTYSDPASSSGTRNVGKKATKPKQNAAKKGKRRKADSDGDESGLEVYQSKIGEDERPAELRWVKLEDVERANVGTGVLKVWKAAQKLWTKAD